MSPAVALSAAMAAADSARTSAVRARAPSGKPLGDTDVHRRRHGIGIVVSRALDVDDAGQHVGIDIEQAGAAMAAKVSPAVFRGIVDLGLAFGHLECALRIHRPADDGSAGVEPAIAAVTQRMHDRVALDLVTDCAAVTAAGDGAHSFLPVEGRYRRSITPGTRGFNDASDLKLRPTVA